MGSVRVQPTNGGTRTPSERFLRPVCIPFHHVSVPPGPGGARRAPPGPGGAAPWAPGRRGACLLVDSNHRHRDFQSLALPPELKRPSAGARGRAARGRPPLPAGRRERTPGDGRKGMKDSNLQSTPPKGAALPIWPMPSGPRPFPFVSSGPRPFGGPPTSEGPILHDPLAGGLPPLPEGTLWANYLLAGGVKARFGGGMFAPKNPWGGDGKRAAPA